MSLTDFSDGLTEPLAALPMVTSIGAVRSFAKWETFVRLRVTDTVQVPSEKALQEVALTGEEYRLAVQIQRIRNGRTVFESGALNRDGSIQGNVNDTDPSRFEPHFREITSGDAGANGASRDDANDDDASDDDASDDDASAPRW